MIPDAEENDIIRSMWDEFVTIGHISKPQLVRPEILDSWKRSGAKNVDPFKKTNPVVLTPEELRARQEAHADLIAVAEPIMKKMHEFIKIKDSLFVTTLSDSEGYVIKVVGDPREYGSFSNLYEGSQWSESCIGTNALGTPLATGKPIQIQGAEHYCFCAHSAACSGAPIYDPEGSVVAVLNITGRRGEFSQRHTLGMVVAAADAITSQLRFEKMDQQKQIILESLPSGIVVLNRDGFITHINGVASETLKLDHDYVVGKKLDIFLTRKTTVNKNLIETLNSDANVTDELYSLDIAGGTIQCRITLRPLISRSGSKEGIVITLVKAKRVRQMPKELIGLTAHASFTDIIGQEPLFLASLRLARKVAASDATVVITGESGTGKEIFAQSIHNASDRAGHPFIAVNCGAIPRDLLESELFGYEEGAFTGARKGGNVGKFELANGGTLFLDEIGEMPLDMQVALLRVLEEHAIVRIGGKKPIPISARIIAATNRNLAEEITDGNFRTDLFYRLSVINIDLPPLRKRKGDVPLLARELARGITGTDVTIETDAMSVLADYTYPGNIRELKNIIEYALAIGESNRIGLDVLPEHVKKATCKRMNGQDDANPVNRIVSLKGLEIDVIRNFINECNGNISLAAKQLGINRSTIYRKLSSEARWPVVMEEQPTANARVNEGR